MGSAGHDRAASRSDCTAEVKNRLQISCNWRERPKIRIETTSKRFHGAALVSTWVRIRCGACRAECARKTDSNKLTANDERFALAA